MTPGRDALFQELFGRDPSKDELQRFDRMGSLMGLTQDDSMWYVIIVNEFYDDRLKNRLLEVDRVAEGAAKKALLQIAESVVAKADSLAAQRNRGAAWRAGALSAALSTLLCAVALNAGYVMGSGNYPFWMAPKNGLQKIAGWFLNVPSGWIFLLGSSPFLVATVAENSGKIAANKRLGLKNNPESFLKSALGALALVLIWSLVLFVL